MAARSLLRLLLESLAAAALLLASIGAWPDQGPVQIQVENPRPFGYVVGDLLQRRIRVEAAKPWTIALDSLPKAGRIDQWLELRGAQMETRTDSQTTRYDVVVAYQLFNSPEEVKLLTLPRLALRFSDGAGSMVQEVPESQFTAAPVTPAYVMGRGDLDEIRPDRSPQPIPAERTLARLGLYAFGISAILLYFAYVRFGIPVIARRNMPFARAYRELKHLRKSSADEDALRATLRRVHRAFDETAGATVVAEQLDAFFARNPRFAGLRPAAEEFFRLSRREFFEGGAGHDTRTLEWLVSLCHEWRDLERRMP